MSQYQDDNEWEDWGPSKSQLKRDAEALQKMGEEIVSLSHSELEKIPLDEELAEAVELGRKLKPKKDESFRRHLQFIGRLMRSRDVEPIVEALSIIKNRHSTVNARLHRLEQWRERLINEGDSALNELMSQFHERAGNRRAKAPQANHHDRVGVICCGKPFLAADGLKKSTQQLAFPPDNDS